MFYKLFNTKPFANDLMSLLMRLCFGGFMAYSHGWGKLMRWDELQNDFADPFGMPMWLAAGLTIFAEFYCSLLIVAGLFTRISTIPLILCMVVAAFKIHAGDPLDDREGALTYLIAFVVIFLNGSGKYSLDHLIWTRIEKPEKL